MLFFLFFGVAIISTQLFLLAFYLRLKFYHSNLIICTFVLLSALCIPNNPKNRFISPFSPVCSVAHCPLPINGQWKQEGSYYFHNTPSNGFLEVRKSAKLRKMYFSNVPCSFTVLSFLFLNERTLIDHFLYQRMHEANTFYSKALIRTTPNLLFNRKKDKQPSIVRFSYFFNQLHANQAAQQDLEKKSTSEGNERINEQIDEEVVRLIDSEGHMLGIVGIDSALQQAAKEEKDLVEISPNAIPPVCKIIKYGKYLYHKKKREMLTSRKQKSCTIKEIHLSVRIAQHDLDFKLANAKRFLLQKHRIKVLIPLRGRENLNINAASQTLEKFGAQLRDISSPEKIQTQGYSILQFLNPKKGNTGKKNENNVT